MITLHRVKLALLQIQCAATFPKYESIKDKSLLCHFCKRSWNHPSIPFGKSQCIPPLFLRELKLFTRMNSLLLLIESVSLVSLTGLLITIYGLHRAPVGFQHRDLFYYGEPPAGMIPVELDDSSPRYADWI